MATGDIRNNLQKLSSELKFIKYEEKLDLEQMVIGLSAPFLPILYHVFVEYSNELTSYFLSKGYNFYGKSDAMFMESVYRILIQEFQTKPLLTKQQFFTIGFAEVKVIFVTKILKLCIKKNKDIMLKLTLKKKLKCNSDLSHNIVFGNGGSDLISKCYSDSDDNEVKPVLVPAALFSNQPLPTPELALTPVKKISNKSSLQTKDSYCDLPISKVDESKITLEKSQYDSSITNDDLSTAKTLKQSQDDLYFNKDSKLKDDAVLPHILQHLKQNSITLEHLICQANPTVDEISIGVSPNVNFSSSCPNCKSYAELVQSLDLKVQKIEHALELSSLLNNDLKARVSIMEIQIKGIENKFSEIYFTKETDKSAITDEPENQTSQDSEESNVGEYLNKTGEAVNRYSPIKYTDDEEIIKDFKPIRFKDVYGTDCYFRDEEKENIANSKFLSNSQGFKVLQESNMQSNSKNTADRFSSTNVLASNNPIFDQRTSETVRSVKQRLEDTEKLLLEKRKKVSAFV